MACDPMSVKMMMKKLAGFHSFDAGDAALPSLFLSRRNRPRSRIDLGIIDCHIDGWAYLGSEVEVERRRNWIWGQ